MIVLVFLEILADRWKSFSVFYVYAKCYGVMNITHSFSPIRILALGLIVSSLSAGSIGAPAQTEAQEFPEQAVSASSGTVTPEMIERFERLEAETKRLREEVARLEQEKTLAAPAPTPAPSPAPSAASVSSVLSQDQKAAVSAAAVSSAASSAASSTVSGETMTRAEVDAYIEKYVRDSAWRIGPVRVTPYGRLWASVIGSTSRPSPQDAIHHILPSDTYGQFNTAFQARSSRLGLNIEAPEMCTWLGKMRSSGKVEVDFRNDTGNAENKGSILLREVYWQLENEDWKFLFGQTKDVISPLNTGMLNYYNLWDAGNIGYRNPQFQITRYFYWSQNTRMEFTTSLSQMCGSDYSAYDHTGSYPTVMGRVGWTIARPCCKYPVQFGISGHIGEQRYDFPGQKTEIDSWSANLDMSVPFTNRCGIRGELFTGEGLAGVYGGVSQGIDYDPLSKTGTCDAVKSTGGWLEFWWDWTEQLHYHLGYGIDDPDEEDAEAISIAKNSVIYTNLVYDFTKFLRTGIEYSYWTTDYREGNPAGEEGEAHVVEWMWQLEF